MASWFDKFGNAVINGVSSLLGAGVGAYSQSSTNDANKAIARETNAMQERMFHEQLAYNTEMWHKNNDYNTPSAQAQRYRAAGMNPYIMMSGQGGIGLSASPAAGTNVPQMQRAEMQAYDPTGAFIAAGQGFSDGRLKQSEIDKNNAEAQGHAIDNITRNTENLARIEKAIADAKDATSRAKLQDVETSLKNATFGSVVYQAQLQNMEMEERIKVQEQTRLSLELDNIFKDMRNQNYPQEFSAMLAETWSRVKLNNVKTATEVAQQKKLAQDVVESVARACGLRMDNYVKNQTQQALINSANANSERALEEAENVSLFGIPNPSYYVDTELRGGIGVAGYHTKQQGYGNITSAKKTARENAKKVGK